MKIGLSYSRCVRDIVEGKVSIDDVLVVISRTDFDPHIDEQWTEIWLGYGGGTEDTGQGFFSRSRADWAGFGIEDEARFRQVSIDLMDSGKLHQPRKFGAHPRRRPEYWLEAVLPSSELERNPAAKAAWEQFQLVAGLTNTTLDHTYK